MKPRRMKTKGSASRGWNWLAAVILSIFLIGDSSIAQISGDKKEVTDGPFKGTKITGGTIDIKYTPDDKTTPCTKIVFIQVVKRTGIGKGPDGMLGTADDTMQPLKPTDYKNFPGADKKDTWTITSEGKTLDRVTDGTEPYYGGATTDSPGGTGTSTPGSDGGNPKPGTMTDTPTTPAGSFPNSICKEILEFETAAFCAGGQDAGHCFGVIKWKTETVKGEAAQVTITSVSSVTGPPSPVDVFLPDGAVRQRSRVV